MLNLIPKPQKIMVKDKHIYENTVHICAEILSKRIKNAVSKLPCSDNGIDLFINIQNADHENYTLEISENSIVINAESEAAAFYAIQTLRQIFKNKKIPHCYIEDYPDFKYRGFYHDITRGKIPTLETLKKLVDTIAYFKLNSLQLYVEHVFEFEEYKDSINRTGYLTAKEIKELDEYCIENFVELVPSLSTFGHLFELLQKDRYKHLCELENFEENEIFWHNRMAHHTIDPSNPESFELIKSLIDQYLPLFNSDKFNICCDETFDLAKGRNAGKDAGKLYADFVSKIIKYIRSKGKTIMMWADIILKHPENIELLSDETVFLNWCYSPNPNEEQIKTISCFGKTQIVCPGTATWNRLVEDVTGATKNIVQMTEFGKKYGAIGVLNTNWGDWGNPCSLELSMHGLIVGAEKSWNVNTKINKEFEKMINKMVYTNDNAIEYLTLISEQHRLISWQDFARCYSNLIYKNKLPVSLPDEETIHSVIKNCNNVISILSSSVWKNDEYRTEALIAAEGVLVMTELFAKMQNIEIQRNTNTKAWLSKYRQKWIEKNKESELAEIEKMFLYLEDKFN